MLRAVLPLFRTFLGRLGEGAVSDRRTRSRAKLEVTPLEDRCLLAGIEVLWVAQGNNANFSTAANWAKANGAPHTPEADDTLIFDPSQTWGGMQGSNTASTNDIAGLSLTELKLAPGYGETVTLNQSLSTQTLTMRNGTITSAVGIDLTIMGGAGSSQFGGTGGPRPKMTGAGSTIIGSGVVDFEIDGFIELEQRTLTNNGKIIWNAFDDEPINTNNATINNKGTFEIKTNSKIRYTGAPEGPFGSFNTTGLDGKVTKTWGAGGSAVIEIPFNVSMAFAGAVTIKKDSGDLTLRGGGYNLGSSWVIEQNTNAQTVSRVYFDANAGFWANYFWDVSTTLTGAGFYTVLPNATSTVGAPEVLVDKLELNGGRIDGSGELKISKELKWLAGVMAPGPDWPGKTTLLGGPTPGTTATAIIGGAEFAGGPLILDGRIFNNNGRVTLKGNSSTPVVFNVQNGAVINNTKTFNIDDDSDIFQTVGPPLSKFINTGWLEKTGGNDWSEIGVIYEEPGAGNFRRSQGKFRFSGPVKLLGGVFDTNGGEVQVTGLYEQSGATVHVSGAEAILSIASLATVSGGTINVALGGTFTASSGFAHSGGDITVMGAGTTLNASNGYAQSGGTITVGGTGGKVSVYGSFVLSGGDFILDNGLVTAFSGLTIASGGKLTINTYAGLTGNLTNEGLLTLKASALLDITGDYTQSGTLKVELASSSVYGRMTVSGDAALGGTLDIDLIGGYSPIPGTSFTLLTCAELSGSFTTTDLPPLGFGVWHQTYNPASFVLWVSYF